MFWRFLVLIVCLIGPGFSAGAEIGMVRIAGDGAPTRVTIWSDTAETADVFAMEADGARRLVLPVSSQAQPQSGAGQGGVTAWSVAGGRLTLTLDRPMSVVRVLRLPPTGSEASHRIILDLDTVSSARFTVAARRDERRLARAEAATSAATASPRELAGGAPEPVRRPARPPGGEAGRFVIVIDPGHGGRDPGALAINGGVEKDITLAAALALRDLLARDSRYSVLLTRDRDVYVGLEDRVTLAREAGANLFISLHADAAASRSVMGASVYTISARGEQRVDREAGRNNWRIPIEDGTPEPVTGILEDLVKRETKTRSAEFAELLIPELASAGPVLRSTHRSAGFYVLLAPDVPAVLLELGFLTNQEDARRLNSEAGRLASARAIKRAIDTYFDRQDRLLAAH
jgi:N-acetylmuramoyl-L-alanine amidase